MGSSLIWQWSIKTPKKLITTSLKQLRGLNGKNNGYQETGSNRPEMKCSLRKQPTFHDTLSGFPAKWHLRNERRCCWIYFILMTRHYPDLGNAFDWLKQRGATNFSARFAGKPVVASLNVRCLLRPDEVPSPCRNPEESFWYTQAVPTSS